MRHLTSKIKIIAGVLLVSMLIVGISSALGITTISNASIRFFDFAAFNKQASAPANPPTGNLTIFAKTDDIFYRLTSGGAESAFVFTDTTQTLSSKTLSSPTMSGTIGGTYTIGGTPSLGTSLGLDTDNSRSIGTSLVRLANLFAAGTVNGTTVRANNFGASTGSTITMTGTPTIAGTYTIGGTPTLATNINPDASGTRSLGSGTLLLNNIFGTTINGTTLRGNTFTPSTGTTSTFGTATSDIFQVFGGAQLKSSSATEIGIQTTNAALTVGSFGTFVLPVATTTGFPTDAEGGNLDGSIVFNTFDNTLYCRDGSSWVQCGGQGAFRRWGIMNMNSGITSQFNGMLQGAAEVGTEATLRDADGKAANYPSAATIGANAGFKTADMDICRLSENCSMFAKVKLSSTSNVRLYVGFSSTDADPAGDDPLNAANGVMLCALTTQANFQWCRNEGAGATVLTDTGVAKDTAAHKIEIIADAANSRFLARLDSGTVQVFTTSIPAAAQNLGIWCEIETSDAVSKSLGIYSMKVENDV